MHTFKSFINEERVMNPLHIEVDARTIENNKDAMNADFDRLTANPYQNAIIFYNQLRATLERYGMIIPPSATRYFLNFDSEMSFTLGDSDLHLYVVFNTHKNSNVEAYAQVVDATELDNLLSSDEEVPREDDEEEGEEEGEEENEEMEDDEDEMSAIEKYRKRDSDAGDTSEY